MEQTNQPKITINGQVRLFTNPAELRVYLTKEQHLWSWLAEIRNTHRDATAEMYNILFAKKLAPLIALVDQNSSQINDLTLGDINNPYIESDSPEGSLIHRTREYYGNLTAALLLLYTNEQIRNLCAQSGNIRNFSENSALSYERTIAIQLQLTSQDFGGLVGETRVNTLDKALKDFSTTASSSLKKIQNTENDIDSHVRNIKDDLQKNASSIQKSYRRRSNAYKNLAAQTREEANKSLEEAQHRLASAKAAYDDQIDLDASVKYWMERKSSHSTFKYLWLAAVVVSMAVTFGSLLSYYSFGGAAGLAKHIHTQPSVELQITPSPIATLPETTSSAATQPTKPILLAQTGSELSLAIADLAGAALLITLLAVLIRIALRQFNTHSHFALDAEERITFTKTYLALLNEGKLKADEDRRLILESLFRPSQHGNVAETTFSSPIELILKTLTDKKPTT